MAYMSRDQELQSKHWSAVCGQLSALSSLVDLHIVQLNQLRDQGAPEDVLEAETTALARLNEVRKALADANRRLWTRVES